jgi:DNA-binding NtrC family response regulator
VLAAGPAIEEADLRLEGARGAPSVPPRAGSFADAKRAVVDDFERTFLTDALRQHGGNVSRTAEAIGMVRQSLQQKIRELGLRDDDEGEKP